MGLRNTLSFITSHPLTRDRPLSAIGRFVRWQIGSRLQPKVKFQWIEGATLVVRNGMTGATGNIYCGMHEFVEMAFVLHCLRPGDLFVDVGANIGSYTVLAVAVAGADAVTIEPDPNTVAYLRENIAENNLEPRVEVVEAALGATMGTARLTVGRDTMNMISSDGGEATRVVEVQTLDHVLVNRAPTVIKLDVEGFESEVLRGSSESLKKRSLLAVVTESQSREVVECLNRNGFSEIFYDPFERKLSAVKAFPQSNGLYIRDKVECAKRVESARVIHVLGREL